PVAAAFGRNHPSRRSWVMKIQGACILVVEDEAVTRQALSADLTQRGASVLQAANGAEGLRRLAEHPEIELVVTDIIMPDVEGITFIRKARCTHPRLKIVAMSGGGFIDARDYLDSARTFGADAVLEKP